MPGATGFENTQTKLKQYFEDNWHLTTEGGSPDSIPLFFENDSHLADPLAEYIEVHVHEVDTVQITCGRIGDRRWRIVGMIVAIVRGRLNDGSTRLRKIADSVRDLLQGIRIDNVSFRACKVVPVGREEAHYRINVQIGFILDYIA